MHAYQTSSQVFFCSSAMMGICMRCGIQMLTVGPTMSIPWLPA